MPAPARTRRVACRLRAPPDAARDSCLHHGTNIEHCQQWRQSRSASPAAAGRRLWAASGAAGDAAGAGAGLRYTARPAGSRPRPVERPGWVPSGRRRRGVSGRAARMAAGPACGVAPACGATAGPAQAGPGARMAGRSRAGPGRAAGADAGRASCGRASPGGASRRPGVRARGRRGRVRGVMRGIFPAAWAAARQDAPFPWGGRFRWARRPWAHAAPAGTAGVAGLAAAGEDDGRTARGAGLFRAAVRSGQTVRPGQTKAQDKRKQGGPNGR